MDEAEIARLREGNQALAAQLKSLQDGLAAYQRKLEDQNDLRYAELQREIDTTRFISRYSRRTWFMVMAFLVFCTVLLGDLARAYADSGWWGFLLWSSQHGAGGPWEWAARAVGLGWQLYGLAWIWRFSDMPNWLDDRADMLTLSEEAFLRKWPTGK